MTVIGGEDATAAVERSAGLVGYEASRTEPPTDAVEFVDFPFTADSLDLDGKIKAVEAAVEKHQPRIAVGPDIEGDMTVSMAAKVGDRLLDLGADHVVLTPKDVPPASVPERFRVGFPAAAFGSGSRYGIRDYAAVDGDGIHILGGVPQDQIEAAGYGLDVESVDGSAVETAAKNYDIWNPNGPNWWVYAGAGSDLYERIEQSLDNISWAWADIEGVDHPTLDGPHEPKPNLGRDVAVVDPERVEGADSVTGWSETLLDAVDLDPGLRDAVLAEFEDAYAAAVYASTTDRPAADSRAARNDTHTREDQGGRLLDIEGFGIDSYDAVAALSPLRLEHYPEPCDRVYHSENGEFSVECGEGTIEVIDRRGEWSLDVTLTDGPDSQSLDRGNRAFVTESAKAETLLSTGRDPGEYRPGQVEADVEGDLGDPPEAARSR
jgi:hypothetical protein